MEKFYTIIFAAGLGCFILAFVLSLVFPVISLGEYTGMEYRDMESLTANPHPEFVELSTTFPEAFNEAFGTSEPTPAAYSEALRLGRDLYVGQACWHCHSQYVRPVSNEVERFGPLSIAQEYNNALNQPHLWGTRRVGPDLARENGKHTNDWHIAHFMNPRNVVPNSVMPSYKYYFTENGTPKLKGFAILAYVQWLGRAYEELPEEAKLSTLR